MITIKGTGGIGKTALADAVCRQVITQGAVIEFGWVSAKQLAYLPGLGVEETGHPALTVELLVDALLLQWAIPIPLVRAAAGKADGSAAVSESRARPDCDG